MNPSDAETSKFSSLASAQPCRRFSLAEIETATRSFDDGLVIGRGGFGKVYKGHVSSGEMTTVVAIKRLDSTSNQGAPEFRAEIEMLSRLRHCHLVSLIGYCDDNKELILVYDYMPHGTLHDHLHKAPAPLDWMRRLRIAIGAARGMDYLHTGVGTQHGVIHRDVKSSNILLDENWAAMISDFGLSTVGPTNQSSSSVYASVKGTFGYIDPEYFYTGRLTRKTDVFAFGVVLFELLSGRLAVDTSFGEEQCSLIRWAQKCVKERRLDQIVDQNIRGKISPKCLKQFAQTANHCLNSGPKKRPTMAEVVVSLQLSQTLQERFDYSAQPSGAMGFTWKMPKYFVFSSKPNSEREGSSTKEDSGGHRQIPHSGGERTTGGGERPTGGGERPTEDLKLFSYSELKSATRNFRYQTDFGNGNIFKGWVDEMTYTPSELDIGLAIAVEKLHRHNFESLEKATLDLKILREFSHPNLVKLLGYCLKHKTLHLVYELMQKGSLGSYLHNRAVTKLPLVTKAKIAVGIGRGLVFLHQTQKQSEVLSWRKDADWFGTHNILLDEDFNAKLSGFDVSKSDLSYKFVDHDNGYYYPGCEPLRIRSDAYGFGVVLAELLTGKPIRVPRDLYELHRLSQQEGKMIISSPRLLFGKKTFPVKWKPENLSFFHYPQLLYKVAKFCLEICNDVESEWKMLQVIEIVSKYIHGESRHFNVRYASHRDR